MDSILIEILTKARSAQKGPIIILQLNSATNVQMELIMILVKDIARWYLAALGSMQVQNLINVFQSLHVELINISQFKINLVFWYQIAVLIRYSIFHH